MTVAVPNSNYFDDHGVDFQYGSFEKTDNDFQSPVILNSKTRMPFVEVQEPLVKSVQNEHSVKTTSESGSLQQPDSNLLPKDRHRFGLLVSESKETHRERQIKEFDSEDEQQSHPS